MTDLDVVLRAVLTAEAFVALVLSGQALGHVWWERTWPQRVAIIGAIGVLTYVLAGQAKAYLLNIPFDWFSAIGMAAYTVLLIGLVWLFTRERRARRRGR